MSGSSRKNRQEKDSFFDYTLLFIVIFLVGFGMVMLFSVSGYESQSQFGNPFSYLKKQAIAAALGFALMIYIGRKDYHIWQKFSFPLYIISALLCVGVMFLGDSSNGSSRWYRIGGLSFQPSELAKVAVIIFVAALLCKVAPALKRGINFFKVVLFVYPVIIAIALTNLSTAIIVGGIFFAMMLVVSPKLRYCLVLFAVSVAGGAGYAILKGGYQKERILVWLHPEEHQEKAYQTLQGLYAIGSGGIFGKGLGGSMQKLGYVPEAQNDMIFSIICEELGLFGAICVIALFVMLIWRCLVLAVNARDMFGSLVMVGIMTHISLQIVLNIAVVTNSMPNTGVTLPFISYGGSSMMILLAEMGIALSVSRGIRLKELDTGGTKEKRELKE